MRTNKTWGLSWPSVMLLYHYAGVSSVAPKFCRITARYLSRISSRFFPLSCAVSSEVLCRIVSYFFTFCRTCFPFLLLRLPGLGVSCLKGDLFHRFSSSNRRNSWVLRESFYDEVFEPAWKSILFFFNKVNLLVGLVENRFLIYPSRSPSFFIHRIFILFSFL